MAGTGDPEIPDVEQTLETALRKSGADEIPPRVHEVTRHHIACLAKLVRQLRSAGVDEDMVRHSTKQLLQSYEDELLNVLMDLAGHEEE
jgi:hypothetical protein